MSERKYVGVPTQEEIIEQYNEITKLTKEIFSVEQVKELIESKNNLLEVEINYNPLSDYKNEPIEVIRYEYKNILVYADISDNCVKVRTCITVYSDDGLQFSDENYLEYEAEIERVAKMGLLQLN